MKPTAPVPDANAHFRRLWTALCEPLEKSSIAKAASCCAGDNDAMKIMRHTPAQSRITAATVKMPSASLIFRVCQGDANGNIQVVGVRTGSWAWNLPGPAYEGASVMARRRGEKVVAQAVPDSADSRHPGHRLCQWHREGARLVATLKARAAKERKMFGGLFEGLCLGLS